MVGKRVKACILIIHSSFWEGRNVGAYKCLACVSRSSPGEVVDEIGIGPES